MADSYVQLLTPIRDDSPVAKYLEKRGEGIHHVGYRVDDCAAALERVKAAGPPGDRRGAPARQPGHDRRVRAPEDRLRHPHRARPGVSPASGPVTCRPRYASGGGGLIRQRARAICPSYPRDQTGLVAGAAISSEHVEHEPARRHPTIVFERWGSARVAATRRCPPLLALPTVVSHHRFACVRAGCLRRRHPVLRAAGRASGARRRRELDSYGRSTAQSGQLPGLDRHRQTDTRANRRRLHSRPLMAAQPVATSCGSLWHSPVELGCRCGGHHGQNVACVHVGAPARRGPVRSSLWLRAPPASREHPRPRDGLSVGGFACRRRDVPMSATARGSR